jgi:hypothetical protein
VRVSASVVGLLMFGKPQVVPPSLDTSVCAAEEAEDDVMPTPTSDHVADQVVGEPAHQSEATFVRPFENATAEAEGPTLSSFVETAAYTGLPGT